MNTQSTTKTSGFKAGLKTLLVVGGTLLIPFYAIYFNDGIEEKKKILNSSKPVVNQVEPGKIKSSVKPGFKTVNTVIAQSKIEKEVPALPKIDDPDNKSFDVVYKFYRDTHGEGTVFTWKGYEYLVDTLVEVIPASKYDAFDDFDKAFGLARKDLGPCSKFNYKGNKYLTCILGETTESVASANKVENSESPIKSFKKSRLEDSELWNELTLKINISLKVLELL